MEGDCLVAPCVHDERDFNPRPPHGGRLCIQTPAEWSLLISIHALRMEGDAFQRPPWGPGCNFNPRPPHGGRPDRSAAAASPPRYFNPRPPHGGRRRRHGAAHDFWRFQSTPSAWRATPVAPSGASGPVDISIHALRMEGDSGGLAIGHGLRDFNPRPPHGGRRRLLHQQVQRRDFNPRPPHGGRLAMCDAVDRTLPFQSTPSAWRATGGTYNEETKMWISIHALRMEGDAAGGSIVTPKGEFQSTPSAWRATISSLRGTYAEYISIHALRMEGDFLPQKGHASGRYFNPRPPHGGRHGILFGSSPRLVFQSTPSVWRATS